MLLTVIVAAAAYCASATAAMAMAAAANFWVILYMTGTSIYQRTGAECSGGLPGFASNSSGSFGP